jgi:hypothetical protein
MAYPCTVASPVSPVTMVPTHSPADPYLPIEEVARRLDLPLGILVRRAEAGDIPVRRVDTPDGPRFSVRLSDLGVERDSGEEPGDATTPAASLDVVGSARTWGQAATEPAPTPQQASPPVVLGPAPSPEPVPLVPAIQRDPRFPVEPRREVAGMTLDPRELVAGLLDRWERTLEQRIYAEQRQRFESELNARQNLVKQLQLELQTVRAENAAGMADRDRHIADAERTIAQLSAELAEARAATRRRGWPFRH